MIVVDSCIIAYLFLPVNELLDIPLVTADKKLLRAFPERAVPLLLS